MDGQSTESKMRQTRSLVLDGPLPYLPHFFQLDPSSPEPVHGMWAAEKGKAILESDGNRRVLEAEGRGVGRLSPPLAAEPGALRAAWPQAGEAQVPAERLKSHSYLLHETSALLLLFASQLAPSPEEGNDPRRRGRADWLCPTEKGYGQWDFRNKLNFGFLTFLNRKN